MMEVKKDTDDETTIVSIIGEIDSTNAESFELKLREAVDGEKKVVLDLADLEYISSAGLRIILVMQKMLGGGDALTIVNPNEELMDIFKATGFSKLFNLR